MDAPMSAPAPLAVPPPTYPACRPTAGSGPP